MAKRKVKKKRRRLKIKNILIFLIILILIGNFVYVALTSPIKNIYVIGNNILKDEDIIKESNIESYPSFILTSSLMIKKRLLKNEYIENVKITKQWWGKIYIDIEEYTPICIIKDTDKVILSNGKQVNNTKNIDEVPYLINDNKENYDIFIRKFNLVKKEILLQISEISYSPTEVDNNRYYLSMNDGNYIYITLTKIKRLNKYNEIKEEMNGKKGIIYLDSGNYVEVKD